MKKFTRYLVGGYVLRDIENQMSAIEEIEKFIESEIPVCFLKGYAGTGKTTLVEEIIIKFKDYFNEIELLASTGTAARNLEVKTKRDTLTIHKYLYKNMRVDVKDTGIFQSQFSSNEDNLHENILYIIDEASMIGNTPLSKKQEKEKHIVFSQEKLLEDIINILLKSKPENKIIFVGDPCQLPAIRENKQESPALSKEYFKKNFNIETCEVFLKKIHRQKVSNAIVENSMILRESIDENINPKDFKLIYKKNEVERISEKKFYEMYLEKKDELLLIVKTNIKALYMSNKIRKMQNLENILSTNEKLLVVKNDYITGLMNGDFVEVMEVNRNNIVTSEKIIIGEKSIELRLLKAKINIKNIKDKDDRNINIGILLNYLNDYEYPESSNIIESAITKISSLSNSTKDVNKFLNILLERILRRKLFKKDDENYKKFRKKILEKYEGIPFIEFDIFRFMKRISLNKTSINESLSDKILDFYNKEVVAKVDKDNVFYKALRVRYGYAITCYKAQGKESNNVFINDFALRDHKDMRWLYTAITRAKERIYVIKEMTLNKELRSYYENGYIIENIELKRLVGIDGNEEVNNENKSYLNLNKNVAISPNKFTNKWLKNLLRKLEAIELESLEHVLEIFKDFNISIIEEEKISSKEGIYSIFETYTETFSGNYTKEKIKFYFKSIKSIEHSYNNKIPHCIIKCNQAKNKNAS